jgi:hypothetical protein
MAELADTIVRQRTGIPILRPPKAGIQHKPRARSVTGKASYDLRELLGIKIANEFGTVRNLVCGAIVTPMEGDYGDQEGHIG